MTVAVSERPDIASMTLSQVTAERADCIAAAQELNESRADKETGLLNTDDQAAFDALLERADECLSRRKILAQQSFEEAAKRGRSTMQKTSRVNEQQHRQAAFVNVKTGEPVYALAHGERLNDDSGSQWQLSGGDSNRLGVGETIRQLVTGEGGSPEFAANIGNSGTAGGYLLTETFSKDVLDLARSASVVSRAGARTVPMDSNVLHMARLTQDVTAHWRGETVPIPSSEVAFDSIRMSPRVVAALTTVSVELLEDATNASEIIETSMAAALGGAIDRAALFGIGAAEEPLGLFNVTGVNSETSVGTPDDYVKLTSAVRQILTANYAGEISSLAWLGHPRDFATYDGMTDTTGQPLRPTPWASQLRPLSTTSFSTTESPGTASSMVVGDFSQLLIGMRTSGVRIEVFRSGSVTDAGGATRNAVTDMMVHIRAYMRCDTAVMRPSWFTKLTGVTAT